jgi:hypothetical protein
MTTRPEAIYVADSVFAAKALYDYIRAKKIPRGHFCRCNYMCLLAGLEGEYKKYPEIHTGELDGIIKTLRRHTGPLALSFFAFKRKILKRIRNLLG